MAKGYKEFELPLDETIKFGFEQLLKVIEILLGEHGCHWDKKQTHESLRRYLIEEAYEVVEAINNGDDTGLQEELGDVLFQVLFHASLAAARGSFDIGGVIDGITRKMVTRHSHIFGGEDHAQTPEEVLDLWEVNKTKEKGYTSTAGKLKAVPKELPALIRAEKVLTKAEDSNALALNLDQEIEGAARLLEGLKAANQGAEADFSAEIGKILWSITNISRYLEINAEFALTNATETFINRFEYIDNALDS